MINFILLFLLIKVIIIVSIFDAVLKGIALWDAGKNRRLRWFIVLFIFNTAGILPILYLLYIRKKTEGKEAPKRRRRR